MVAYDIATADHVNSDLIGPFHHALTPVLFLAGTYLFFKNLPRLEGAGAFVAVIRYAPFVDHYVALLEVRDGHVVVGDPLVGKTTLPRAEFEKKWRHSGVALRRK